jgi:hypothetical protein
MSQVVGLPNNSYTAYHQYGIGSGPALYITKKMH